MRLDLTLDKTSWLCDRIDLLIIISRPTQLINTSVPAYYLVCKYNLCFSTTPLSLAVMWVKKVLTAITLLKATAITALTLGANYVINASTQVPGDAIQIRVPNPFEFTVDDLWFTASDYHEPYIHQSTALTAVSLGAMRIWRKVSERANMHPIISHSQRNLTLVRILN